MSALTPGQHSALADIVHGAAQPIGGKTLLGWVRRGGYELTEITRDADGLAISATVAWPDGTTGEYVTDAVDDASPSVDAYTMTYPAGSIKAVQRPVTRDAEGGVITKPPLAVQRL